MAQDSRSFFHLFQALPYELRRKIWMQHLHDAPPLVYRFSIRYPTATNFNISISSPHSLATECDVILVPRAYDGFGPERIFPQLIRSTSASRAVLATCAESREIALGRFPDVIHFRKLPPPWSQEGKRISDYAAATAYPEYALRFDGTRDIIIFHAEWDDQEAVIRMAELYGRAPAAFSRMQHIGITVGALSVGHGPGLFGLGSSYGVSSDDCRCLTEDCADACRREPLPRFLSLFPLLKTFYIARVSDAGSDHGDTSESVWTHLEDESCKCGRGDEDVPARGEVRHKWPIVKAADIDRWCVIWDEQTGCLPTHYLVLLIRQYWRPQFPYYKALEHLDIKFLRRLDPGGMY